MCQASPENYPMIVKMEEENQRTVIGNGVEQFKYDEVLTYADGSVERTEVVYHVRTL